MRNTLGFILFTYLFTLSFQIFAYDKDSFQSYVEKYPNNMAVILEHDQKVTIEVDESTGELAIFEYDYEDVLYLQDASKFYTSQSIYTSQFFEDIIEVDVLVYNQKGKKFKLSDSDFQIMDSPPSSWVFHDDDKELVFDLKNLGAGFRTIISYKKRVKRPEFFDIFHFMSGYPTEKSRLEIICPKDVELKFYEQNLEGLELKKGTTTLKKGLQQYVWDLKDVSEFTKEDGSTNMKNFIPHVIAQIVSYDAYGEKINLIGTADELHSFFQELLLLQDTSEDDKDNKESKPGSMRAIVDEITVGMEDELVKMDTIFNWVQANIKYIAFEDGINGYVPRSCGTVMGNRYGDCKDMGNLLVEMLNYANVSNAHVAWVGTRDIPYQMSEIPTPLACNHVIAVVEKPLGGYYYLDATNAEGSYNLPPRSVQSKELLIHNGMDDYVLFKVPEVEANLNYLKSVIHYRLDEDDSLRGTGTDYFGGYERERRTYSLNNLDNEDLNEYIKDLALGGFNRYTLGAYSMENLHEKNDELIIKYDFSVDNLFIEDGEDLILNPTLFKPRITQYNTTDHSLTRHKNYHRTVDYQFEFEIPQGYQVKHLPDSENYKHDLFDFAATFALEGNLLVVKMKYQYHLLEIPISIYEEWNAFSKTINNATIQNIILQKI